MKEANFQIFLTALLDATANIKEKYFRLPVAYGGDDNYVYRERAYCYELYHQIRLLLPNDFPYTLSGEINKAGHPLIAIPCGSIIPDFLVHNPGYMGEDDNLVIVEVKTIQGAGFYQEGQELLKDIDTINCMTTIENGYYRGIILIFGEGLNARRERIVDIFRERCNGENLLLIFHENSDQRATIV